MLFDTHLHLIYPDILKYPWLDKVDSLNKPSHYEDYHIKASRLGISACLHMEVDVVENQIKEETKMIHNLIENNDTIIRGVISSCRPEKNNFQDMIQYAEAQPLIKGFRRVLHVAPDNTARSDQFKKNIKLLSDTMLTFDLCAFPHQHPEIMELIDFCPKVTFILDHCGVPNIKEGDFNVWKKSIAQLAQRDNLFCKISGIIAYGDNNTWTLDDIKPYFEHVVNSFGFKRIIWGSDSPVCNLGGGIETWVAATYLMTQDWSYEEKKNFFWSNAINLWDLK